MTYPACLVEGEHVSPRLHACEALWRKLGERAGSTHTGELEAESDERSLVQRGQREFSLDLIGKEASLNYDGMNCPYASVEGGARARRVSRCRSVWQSRERSTSPGFSLREDDKPSANTSERGN